MREPPLISAADYQQLSIDSRFASIIDVVRGFQSKQRFTPIPSVRDQNSTYRLVGKRIYRRPSTETFHEFLMHLLKWTLGKEWHEEQLHLPFQERHQIFKWFRALAEFVESVIDNPRLKEGLHYGDTPTGDAEALTGLAYDIFYLLHLGPIPDELLNRLKDKGQFQGARYEILVAALLMRAGCIPEFIRAKSKKHCDISARDQVTGAIMAIEAKSRHRPGTLGFQGEQHAAKAMRGDVENLINQALEQNPGDRPFMIFVDLNSPHMPETPIQTRPWYNDMQTLMQSLGEPAADKPDDFNTLILTNFSYHWQGTQKATAGDYLCIHSGHPRHLLPSEVTARIVESVQTYGAIPKEI